uniref:Store-operated calcium entry-associated regulatory factor n=1 Tax=Meloidogyne javanica TaxID=6303 RepID=A0A915N9J2_MELJA
MDFNFKIFLKFIFVFIVVFGSGEARQKILLTSLPVLTLYRGSYTEGYKPIKQLECIGGTASGMHSPKVVQCYNKGSDGRDVQWECKAELPVEYEFGRIEVSCEGFDYPEDPYVVVGSCGLRYELDYSKYGAQKGTYLLPSKSSWPDDRRPPPPGWNPPPPSYDDATTNQNYYSNKGPSTSSGSGGPGFFSGLGLGALDIVDVQVILDHLQVIVEVDVPHPLHLVEELHTLPLDLVELQEDEMPIFDILMIF